MCMNASRKVQKRKKAADIAQELEPAPILTAEECM